MQVTHDNDCEHRLGHDCTCGASNHLLDLAAARAEIERLKRGLEITHNSRNELAETWKARAIKAEAERDEARAQVATRAAAAIDAAEAQGATWGQTRLMVRSAILGGDHG